jgi:hypothetical protein
MKNKKEINPNILYSLEDKLVNEASSFLVLKRLKLEYNKFKGVTPSYIDGLNEVYSALMQSFPNEKFNHQILAILLYEFTCEFSSQQITANQVSKIAPSLVKGAAQLPEVISAFKKHPVNISAITFHIRQEKIQYNSDEQENIIWKLKDKNAYKDKLIKIEGYQVINEILNFLIENEKQFKQISDRDNEVQKEKYKQITSIKADAKFRKKTAGIILKFLKVSYPKETINYLTTLGGKLHAFIGFMPPHSLEKHKTKKLQNNYYRSMFKKDL